MQPNERRQYRVAPRSPNDLAVEIVKARELPIPGEITDICAEGLRVFIHQRYCPIFGAGEVLYLHLRSRQLDEPITAPGLVHERAEAEEGCHYVFVFVDPIGLLAKVPPQLAEVFNQRSEFRVEPDPSQPITLTIDTGDNGMRVRGKIRDISTSGLSFDAVLNVERALSKVRSIDVSFELPDSPLTVSFGARIRHRRLTPGGICYGLIFEPDERYFECQRHLTRYIASRQRCLPTLVET